MAFDATPLCRLAVMPISLFHISVRPISSAIFFISSTNACFRRGAGVFGERRRVVDELTAH